MDAHVLIDYYNLPQKVINTGAASLVSQVDSLVRSTQTDTDEIFVRWFQVTRNVNLRQRRCATAECSASTWRSRVRAQPL
jgi:hypothetical protein